LDTEEGKSVHHLVAFVDTAQLNDIDYSPTPTGFVLKASLSSYWSILLVSFQIVWTGLFCYFIVSDWNKSISSVLIPTIAIVALITAIFGWVAVLRVFGTQTVRLDSPNLEIGVGVGPLNFKLCFDARYLDSIGEGDGVISGGRYAPPYKAVILKFKQPVQGRFISQDRFAFGHFLTKGQKTFIINRLRESIPGAS
jgi:hypothetical protein